MTSDSKPKYLMTLSLNVLKHLGLGLYSNVPAVLSEVVANAWDADAEHVDITIDPSTGTITIKDDGHGMTVADANDRYLTVGYERRRAIGGATTPRLGRPVMGRKGIGKLSLFSIAKVVKVHSVRGNDRHGFFMDLDKIEETIANGEEGDYQPGVVEPEDVKISEGTLITLTSLKRQLTQTSRWLRRRLARRFSILGSSHRFDITLDGRPITIEDREYYDKLQYIWTFGQRGEEAQAACRNLERGVQRPVEIEGSTDNLTIDGWIGTAKGSGPVA